MVAHVPAHAQLIGHQLTRASERLGYLQRTAPVAAVPEHDRINRGTTRLGIGFFDQVTRHRTSPRRDPGDDRNGLLAPGPPARPRRSASARRALVPIMIVPFPFRLTASDSF